MFRFIASFLLRREPKTALGRWGYHWEQKMKYNAYYD
jgi:hypothetical protein